MYSCVLHIAVYGLSAEYRLAVSRTYPRPTLHIRTRPPIGLFRPLAYTSHLGMKGVYKQALAFVYVLYLLNYYLHKQCTYGTLLRV